MVLAPRILHFGTHQLYWKCNELATFQTNFRNLNDSRAGPRGKGEFVFENEEVPQPGRDYSSDKQTKYGLSSWNRIVVDYSRRVLTNEEDKLVALSGIAKRYQDIIHDKYIAGHFRNRLPYDLWWRIAPDSKIQAYRPPAYRAPSWSWACVDGQILPAFSALHQSGDSRVLFKVLEVKLDHVSQDSTGQVSGGFLRGCGILKHARWDSRRHQIILQKEPLTEEINELLGRELHRISTRPTISGIFDFPSQLHENQQLYLVPIQGFSPLNLRGLILENDIQPGKFRRVGIWEMTATTDSRKPILVALKYNIPARITYSESEEGVKYWEDVYKKIVLWSDEAWYPRSERMEWSSGADIS